MARSFLFACCVLPAWAYTAYSECDPYAHGQCELGRSNYFKGTLRVAVAQTASNQTATLEENTATHVSWIAKAAKEGARAILFPELSMTGYFAERVVTLAGESGDGDVANARLAAAENLVAAACKEHNIYAIVGVPVYHGSISEGSPQPWYNTALVVGPDGQKVYRQAKLFTCCQQDGSPGKWIDTFNITNFDGTVLPVATQICYDDFHPEIARLQAIAGAQILFYQSWESDVSVEWKLSLGDKLGSAQAVATHHAATNQMFVLQSNAGALVDNMVSNNDQGYRTVVMGGSHGQSRVIDPTGVVLEQARVFGQQMLVHDLDLTMLNDQKHRMPMASLHHDVFGSMWKDGLSRFSKMPLENSESMFRTTV